MADVNDRNQFRVFVQFHKDGALKQAFFTATNPRQSTSTPDGNSRAEYRQSIRNVTMREIKLMATKIFGAEPRMTFTDEEGDRVLLDNVDSYVEAIKVAEKTGELYIWVDPKPCISPKPAVSTIRQPAQQWFRREMEEMKKQLKQDILSEIRDSTSRRDGIYSRDHRDSKMKRGKGDYITRALTSEDGSPRTKLAKAGPLPQQGASLGVVEPVARSFADHTRKVKCRKSDYIAGAIDPAGGADPGTAQSARGQHEQAGPRPVAPVGGKSDYVARALRTNAWLTGDTTDEDPAATCGVCFGPMGDPFFVCLESECMARMCRCCEGAHPSEHAMLRVPGQLKGGRRRTAAAARAVLLTMKPRKRVCHRADRKMAKKKGHSWTARWQTTSVSATGGDAVVNWLIGNTGKKHWDDKVKITCVACSDLDLKPVESTLPLPPVEAGRDTTVSAVFATPAHPGQYDTRWALTHRGKAFADLTARIVVPVQEESAERVCVGGSEQMVVDEDERQQESNDNLPVENMDDDCSETSAITECKSASLEQEYDVIGADEDQSAGEESYVSVPSPVVLDDSTGNFTSLADLWRGFAISTTAADEQTKANEEGELLNGEETVTVEQPNAVDNELQTTVQPDSVGDAEGGEMPVPPATDDDHSLGQAHDYNSEETKSAESSRSNSIHSRRHQLGTTVASAISSALSTTTHTLATVGATAKEIHTAAAAIVRSNFQTHYEQPKEWHSRAWVPKATQTYWTEPREFSDEMARLVEMGFGDVEKNARLLEQYWPDVDAVVSALLDG